MELHNSTSFLTSKLITKAYSTSFSLGISAFAPGYRNAIYAIYGFVRIADEIVDTFHDNDQKDLMQKFRRNTEEALKERISTDPILHAFVLTVEKYKIDHSYIRAFLDSMEMDLTNDYYELTEYKKYIYGSAEVVGLMCLKVFCGEDKVLFENLILPARSLGSAFQKVNFLRDIRSDMTERGRIYLPGINQKDRIDDISKQKLEEEVESEFSDALNGIKLLPAGVRLGVYSAYLYYILLFKKIKRLRIQDLMKKRVRISNITKFALLFRSIVLMKLFRIN